MSVRLRPSEAGYRQRGGAWRATLTTINCLPSWRREIRASTWGNRTSLAPRRSKSGETSLTSLLDLVTGREDWLGGQVGRNHEMEDEEQGIGVV